MTPDTCPICEGRGIVPASFYGQAGDRPVRCRTCGGRQVVEAHATTETAAEDPLDLTGS